MTCKQVETCSLYVAINVMLTYISGFVIYFIRALSDALSLTESCVSTCTPVPCYQLRLRNSVLQYRAVLCSQQQDKLPCDIIKI